MKSRIRGGDAARSAVAMSERLPVALQDADTVRSSMVGADFIKRAGRPPRVRKPSPNHDVVCADGPDLEAHRAELRAAFGQTASDEVVEVLMGKLISGLRPNPFDVLPEATLNAAIAMIASLKPGSEFQALMATQMVIAGFSALRLQELSQRHLGEENIAVYGGYANRLIRLQTDLLQAFDRHRRGNTQTINVHHVDIHPGGRGVIGVVNTRVGTDGGTDAK
ncbi:hypothetical protein ACVIGA_009088 [Bradyrhizobium sp. USDA 3240]